MKTSKPIIDVDKWQEIFNTISRHKLRSVLTAFGVAWGIFILVILLGSGNGLQNGVNYLLRDDAINSVWIHKGTTSKPFSGMKAGRRIEFNNDDFEMISQLDGVEHITGRFKIPNSNLVKRKDLVMNFSVRCVHPDHQYLENTVPYKGRYINEMDIQSFRKVACIGRLVAEGLFKEGEDPMGQSIDIDGTQYTIVGLFEDNGDEDEMRYIYVPISTAQKIYGGSQRIDQIMFTTGQSTPKKVRGLVKQVRKKLAHKYKFDYKDRQAVYINNDLEEFQQYQDLFGMIKFFVWLVGIGCIVAGAIGVSNIMLIIVKDRTREIGVRRAMGATPESIIKLILTESVFLTAMAGYFGLVIGVGILWTTQSVFEWYALEVMFFRNPQINLPTVLGAIGLLVFFGALAGLVPALKAVSIQPVKAIRS